MRDESVMNLDRWLQLMGHWGFSSNEEAFSSLVISYSEKGRHYHTQEHVAACLSHLDRCVSDIDKPREVELALWFHDAIYKPLSGDNEKESAVWAASFLTENRASTNEIARVHRLIMVTEHNAPTKTKDESFIVDIDLSILGADSDIYDVFERGIRSEYKLVPMFIYRKKRAEILQGFLERPKIFQNELFSKERERQAKENLVNAVTKLGGRITNVAELKR